MSTVISNPIQSEEEVRKSWLSVTQILKLSGLSAWQNVSLDQLRRGLECGNEERKLMYIMQGVWPETLDAARERGLLVHQAIRDIEKGISYWWSDLLEAIYIRAYLKFKEDVGYRPVLVEAKVYNETYRYRGTLDGLGMMGQDAEMLIDIKTTAKMDHQATAYQLAGYDLCLPVNPKRRRVGLQLMKDGTYRVYEYNNLNDSKIFLSAVVIATAKLGVRK